MICISCNYDVIIDSNFVWTHGSINPTTTTQTDRIDTEIRLLQLKVRVKNDAPNLGSH